LAIIRPPVEEIGLSGKRKKYLLIKELKLNQITRYITRKYFIFILVIFIPGLEVYADDLNIEPVRTEFVFEITATLDPAINMGQSLDGERLSIPITGGSFTGPGIRGKVLDGGADYQTVFPDGTRRVEAIYMIQTHDGALINVVNRGIIHIPDPADMSTAYIRTVPEFRAPANSPYNWLNTTIFVGTLHLDPNQPGQVRIRVFKVL